MCLICCCPAIDAGFGMNINRLKAKLLIYMILMDINSLKLYHKEGRNATVECSETAAVYHENMETAESCLH